MESGNGTGVKKRLFDLSTLLSAFMSTQSAEALAGDLEEEFAKVRKQRGEVAATIWYLRELIESVATVAAFALTTPKGFSLPVFSMALSYALCCSVGLLVEVAYRWELFGFTVFPVALLTFVFMLTATSGAFGWATQSASQGKHTGVLAGGTLLIVATLATNFIAFCFLPDRPITETAVQMLPARLGYLKQSLYLLPSALVFCLMPLHFVATCVMKCLSVTGNWSVVFSKGIEE
jgi:hypothetical protein